MKLSEHTKTAPEEAVSEDPQLPTATTPSTSRGGYEDALAVIKAGIANGWVFLPARYKEKRPDPSRVPTWVQYQTQRPTEQELRGWFRDPKTNYWLACGGLSRVWVLDIDSPEAEVFWREVCGLADLLDRTPRVKTSKGYHYYFEVPAGDMTKGWAYHVDGCPISFDVRGQGGGVIAPPSTHASGVLYEWEQAPDFEAEGFGLQPLPDCLRSEAALHAHLVVLGRSDALPFGTKLAADDGPRLGLSELLANPASDGGRNVWLTKVCGHLAIEYRDDQDQYLAEVRAANDLCRPPQDAEAVTKTANSIWEAEQENHPERAGGDSPASGGRGRPDERAVVEYARAWFDFGVTTEGDVFALPHQGVRTPVVVNAAGSRFKDLLLLRFYEDERITPTGVVMDNAMRILCAQTQAHCEPQELWLRVAWPADDVAILDLAEATTSRCVKVTASGWEVLEQPPEGVLFRRSNVTLPLPVPVRGGSLDQLRELLKWEAGDRRWELVRGWEVAAMFRESRPLLLFTGQQGSGKSTRAALAVSVLDPRDSLGSEFAATDDERVNAYSRFLVGYDNISSVNAKVGNQLCRLVTGEEVPRRRLYTDNEIVVTKIKSTGAISAISLPAMSADTLDRLIVIECDPINDDDREADESFLPRFRQEHPQILGALLDDVVRVLGRRQEATTRRGRRPRMATYYNLLWSLSEEAADAYVNSTQQTSAEAAEDDPFTGTVVVWLRYLDKQGRLPLDITPTDAWQSASAHQERLSEGSTRAPYWPDNSSRFSKLITQNAEGLRSLGFRGSRLPRNSRGAMLRFERLGPQAQLPDV